MTLTLTDLLITNGTVLCVYVVVVARAVRAMSGQFSSRVQELATSLVGAAARAAGPAMVPWLGQLLPGLEQRLAATPTPDTEVLVRTAQLAPAGEAAVNHSFPASTGREYLVWKV